MRHFGDLSIRRKLTVLFMAVSGFTALAISAPIATYDVLTLKHTAAQNLAVLGDVLAGNSTAALTFRDAESARDVLRALRAEPDVIAACIYTSDGKPFAKYSRDSSDVEIGAADSANGIYSLQARSSDSIPQNRAGWRTGRHALHRI